MPDNGDLGAVFVCPQPDSFIMQLRSNGRGKAVNLDIEHLRVGALQISRNLAFTLLGLVASPIRSIEYSERCVGLNREADNGALVKRHHGTVFSPAIW